MCLPWFESRTCHVKPQVSHGAGAGANTCLGAVRNTAAFTFWLEVVQVSALPSGVKDRMTDGPGRMRGETSGHPQQALRPDEGSPEEGGGDGSQASARPVAGSG